METITKNGSLDFYEIRIKMPKKSLVEVFPDYQIEEEFHDLMVRGGAFYAVWDEKKKLWNRNERSVKRIIDQDVESKFAEETNKALDYNNTNNFGKADKNFRIVQKKLLRDNSSGKWAEFKNYMKNLSDSYNRLDENVSFQKMNENNESILVNYKGIKMKKTDYVSKSLPYSLSNDEPIAWNEMMDVLYEPDERDKIEWAIGAILTGDAKRIQKFLVFYGPQGSGKSTVLEIVMKLFNGYYTTFKAENLVKGGDNFNLDFLAEDPLVAIDADTNLSKIESNALINQIVSHEQLKVNEKFKNRYPSKPMCMLMLGTNQPVKITDAKSGIIRRLIDIEPSGRLIPEDHYYELNEQIDYELGAIAQHCINVYKELGKTYYSDYIPERMMYRTDAFFNYMEDRILPLMEQQKRDLKAGDPKAVDGISADNIWLMWKDYCEDSGIDFKRKRFEIIDEAKNYFEVFHKNPHRIGFNEDGTEDKRRSWFTGFKFEKFNSLKFQEKKETRREKKLKNKSNPVEEVDKEDDIPSWLKLDQTKSLLDDVLKDYPAQYEIFDKESGQGRPEFKWENVKTTLKDLDTSKTHFIQKLGQLICIDFDIHDTDGKKSIKLCLQAAKKWKPTYAELSNSGKALHLYYWYDGDVSLLSSLFDDEIEIKVYPDDKKVALRRRVTKCNNIPIAHISEGLPLKEKKVAMNWKGVADNDHLRNIIKRAINKEVRPFDQDPKTVTCVKYIRDVLQNAQESGINYDIRDMSEAVYAFAAHSRHNADECIKMFYEMKFVWPEEKQVETYFSEPDPVMDNRPIIILDCEVMRNLTLVVYKEVEPDGKAAIFKKPNEVAHKCIRMFNPKPHEIEKIIKETRYVGHNVLKYDNYILNALRLGKSPEQISDLSMEIVNGNTSVMQKYSEAKSLHYADTYDISNGENRKGLKKIEIEMHIPHVEMETDWKAPLPEEKWEQLADYCENDVLATEAFYLSKAFQNDFKARKILSALTGMPTSETTNHMTAQLIFGNVQKPSLEFNYPNLKEMFPEYRFDEKRNESYYGDVLVGEGGRVYAEPGQYYDVVTFDVASMHPTSIIVEQGFGPYTKNYEDLYKARIAIKHGDYDTARKMFDGRLAPYLDNPEDADALAYALKIALNSVYGLTAAKFEKGNRFKDPRNIDNWVAKRGALFMEKLRREVQARGGHVIHIKTDSIKLVKPSKELSDFVLDFGKKYGYTFEIESRYERICLVNHAVYIALRSKEDEGWLKECKKAKKKAEETETPYIEPTRWTATGAQFAHPYVFKRMFSHEPMNFWDFCETKNVKSSLYLDLNEQLPDVSMHEKEKAKLQSRIKKLNKELLSSDISEEDKEKINRELADLPKDIEALDSLIAEGHAYTFVGKTGEFMPVIPGCGGGLLMRKDDDGGYGYAVGAKGYRWLESESMEKLADWKKYVDIRYFRGLVDGARDTIGKYCDFDLFVKGEDGIISPDEQIVEYETDPWMLPCKSEKYAYCSDCPDFKSHEDGSCSCKQGYDITNQILGESKETLL